MGGYFFKGGILGTAKGQSFQDSDRNGKALHAYVEDLATLQ